ncbi:MAG: hypothetical protein JF593_10005 [Novosphingobium sp.]|nr:hypothetical protein [Novosphingobium sp.]
MKTFAFAAAAAAVAFAMPAAAQNAPVLPGEYVEVSQITIDDGHDVDYANFLAGKWRAQEEFAKAQGWINSYEILANVNKRAGEPDLYLVIRYKSLPDAVEQARRDEIVRAHLKLTDSQMSAESGERAKYRHVIGSTLLQKLNFR